jgi:peroxiredoxin
MDSFASNKEFGKQLELTFPLLSDWKRETTKAYGLYNEESGYGTRGTFVVDKEGNSSTWKPAGPRSIRQERTKCATCCRKSRKCEKIR